MDKKDQSTETLKVRYKPLAQETRVLADSAVTAGLGQRRRQLKKLVFTAITSALLLAPYWGGFASEGAALPFNLTFLKEAHAMSNNVFCSPIVGSITRNGVPLAFISIERALYGDGQAEGGTSDEVKSDAQGKFTLPVIQKRSLFSPKFFSAPPSVVIAVTTSVDGHLYKLGSFVKHNYLLGGEGAGNPIELNCDIGRFEQREGFREVRCTQSPGSQTRRE